MKISNPYTIFPRTLKSKNKIYYYQYRLKNGCRSTPKSTGCTNKASALRFCNNLYLSGAFEHNLETRFSNFTKNFFSTDSEFYKWKAVNNATVTNSTLKRYQELLDNQLLPYFGKFNLSAISKQEIKNWIIWASEKWAIKTVNNAQTVLNIILNQAVDKNIIDFNPATNLCFRKYEKKDRELLTIDELNACYHSELWNDDNLKNAFLVACITGMRISEVVALRNCDIHDEYLDVQHSYDRRFGLGTTKTKTSRKVPIPQCLNLHNDNSEWLFVAKNGTPIDIVRLLDKLHQIWNSLGINWQKRNLTTHTLRNFFISYLQSENVSESKIRATVGHKDSSMTGLYTYWNTEMLSEVYSAQEKLYKSIKGA